MTEKQKDYYFNLWVDEFWNKFSDDVSLEMSDFESIAIGFFIAKGLDLSDSNKMYQYCILKEKY